MATVTNMTLSPPYARVTHFGSSFATPFPMRRYGLVLLCTLALAALAAVAATVASAHSTPQIRAEQAQERAVLAEVDQIGVKLQAAQDAGWNAKQQVKLVKRACSGTSTGSTSRGETSTPRSSGSCRASTRSTWADRRARSR